MATKARHLLWTICLICFLGLPAQAVWMRSTSLEWWTDISDAVAIATVTDTKKIDPLNEYWNSQEVQFTQLVMLKGDRLAADTFRQDYRNERSPSGPDDAALQPGNRVLLFCARETGSRQTKVVFWVNLTKPDAKLSAHAPYNNNCKWLEDGGSVLSLVRARIAAQNPKDKTKRRGLIVDFMADEPRNMHWDFVRTADAEYKQILTKRLHDGSTGDKEATIYNLVSYPGKDTRNLIRPFLKDPTTSEIQNYSGEEAPETVTIYPLRQAAYLALKLLDEPTEKPEGYRPNAFPWLFNVGFESRTYFPYGDWQRIEDP